MRDLDTRGLLVGDFLLVYGDVVSNLPLESALAAHRARRAKDKNAIMTMVLREAGAKHRTKAQSVNPVFVIDPSKDRCLHFEQMPNKDGTHIVSIDPDLLSSHQEIEIRQDLIDCGIDICTPDVLALWSDNFDFQYPRKGFLHSVLKDYELNGKTLHTHIVTDHYAARVRNLHAYDSVSKDIVSRWAYPLCPDSNLLASQSYRLDKGNVYKEEGVILARDCVIHSKTVIGRGTSVGDGSVISNSIIGRHCQIGRGVKIEGAYIWDYAAIGDGCTVRQAIVANEASLGRNCNVEPGALISYGVAIADGMTIKGEHRITRAKRKREHEDELVKGAPDFKIVGQGGDGFEFEDPDEEDEDEVVEGLIPKASRKSIPISHMPLSKHATLTRRQSLQPLRPRPHPLHRLHLDPKLPLLCLRLLRRRPPGYPLRHKQLPQHSLDRQLLQPARRKLRPRRHGQHLRLARAEPRSGEYST
jgi:translation initiation factor eIF-2B subunit epsilon